MLLNSLRYALTVYRYGKIDILVNNAAVNPYFGTLMTTPVDAWNKIMEVNVTAPFLLAREVANDFHHQRF